MKQRKQMLLFAEMYLGIAFFFLRDRNIGGWDKQADNNMEINAKHHFSSPRCTQNALDYYILWAFWNETFVTIRVSRLDQQNVQQNGITYDFFPQLLQLNSPVH